MFWVAIEETLENKKFNLIIEIFVNEFLINETTSQKNNQN